MSSSDQNPQSKYTSTHEFGKEKPKILSGRADATPTGNACETQMLSNREPLHGIRMKILYKNTALYSRERRLDTGCEQETTIAVEHFHPNLCAIVTDRA